MLILVISLLVGITERRVPPTMLSPPSPPVHAQSADPRPPSPRISRPSDPALLQLWRLFPKLGGPR